MLNRLITCFTKICNNLIKMWLTSYFCYLWAGHVCYSTQKRSQCRRRVHLKLPLWQLTITKPFSEFFSKHFTKKRPQLFRAVWKSGMVWERARGNKLKATIQITVRAIQGLSVGKNQTDLRAGDDGYSRVQDRWNLSGGYKGLDC